MKLNEMAFAKKTYRVRMPRVNPPKLIDVTWPREFDGEPQTLYDWHNDSVTDTTRLFECLTDLAEHSHDMHDLGKTYDAACNIIVGGLITEGSPPSSRQYGGHTLDQFNSDEKYERWGTSIKRWYSNLIRTGYSSLLNDVNIVEVRVGEPNV